MPDSVRSFCRICTSQCGILVDTDGDQVQRVRGEGVVHVPLVLYHFQDHSYEEIAALLSISLAKVKTDIHRGRAALVSQLERLGAGRRELL